MEEDDGKDARNEKNDSTTIITANSVHEAEKSDNGPLIIKTDHSGENGSTIIIKNVTNDDGGQESIAGLPKQSLLLRLFESKLFNMELTLSYLNNSKDAGVLFYLGNRMFTFPPVEVDFYLPQLIVLYVYNTSIGEAIEPYLVSRSKASLFTSMHIVWLLDSFGQELPIGGRRTKSAGHRLRNQILEASDTTSKQHRTNGKSPLSAFHHHHQSNGHRNHCRSLSDATSVIKFGKQQQQQQHLQIASPASRSTSSATSAAAAVKFQLGEHAFDNGPSSPCDSAQPVPASPDVVPSVDGGTSCACLKAKIKSQFEFIRSLMSIGTRMQNASTREQKSQMLVSDLAKLNLNLPARVWLPISSTPHMVLRIPPHAAVLLNSKDKSPFLVYIETIECEDILHSPLPPKHNFAMASLLAAPGGNLAAIRQTKSEDNLMEYMTSIDAEPKPTTEDEGDGDSGGGGETAKILVEQEQPEDEILSPHHYLYRYRPQAFDSISQVSQESAISAVDNIIITAGEVRKRLNESLELSHRLDNEQAVGNNNALATNIAITTTTSTVAMAEDPSVAALKEPWEQKVKRIRAISPYGQLPGWRLMAAIVKCGDDLRQEQLAYQVLQALQNIWQAEKVPLWLRPYRIVVTTADSGLIEPIINSISLHQIKKHSKMSLLDYFITEFGGGSTTSETFLTARYNFVRSCAAYCAFSYILQLKDRHNGNILIDDQGHMIHIDFGFILSNSPKNLGFESSPFKLTQEFIEVMGGYESDMFQYFKCLLLKAFSTLRKHSESLINQIEILIACPSMVTTFANTSASIVRALRYRFHMNLTEEQLQHHIDTMVESSVHSLTTRLYDGFQYYTNGIQ